MSQETGAVESVIKIAVVTTSRADYSLYRPLLALLRQTTAIDLTVIAGGTHLSAHHGMTVAAIEADGYTVAEKVPCVPHDHSLLSQALAIGSAVSGFAAALERCRPDWLVALGDRFEMFAAVSAAYALRVPVLHLYGGDVTEGALDDGYRHAMTKLSHLHCVSTDSSGLVVRQMGEERWRVHTVGSLSVDAAKGVARFDRAEMAARWGFPEKGDFLIATLHSTTQELSSTRQQVQSFLAALTDFAMPVVMTAPNADPGGAEIRGQVESWVVRTPGSVFVESLGTEGYYSACRHARAMVGNSSSGIVEAVGFGLPVVNVGSRQEGRLRSENVIDVPFKREQILAGLERACSDEFRCMASSLESPYGLGDSAAKITKLLTRVWNPEELLQKRFEVAGNG